MRKTKKVIIAGSRTYTDYDKAWSKILDFTSTITNEISEDLEIVSGGAKGADALGERFAKESLPVVSIKLTVFPANWDKHGKSAGFLRNIEMADYADALLAFWDFKSRGTKHMIQTAINKGLIVKVVRI